jgi:hypothetical protein
MSELGISNVINVSVSEAGPGAGEYNTSNLALFTDDEAADSFGSDDYKIYLGPDEVGTDFGTDSNTYKMALKVFSQQPNILANRGYLVVIPFEDGYDVENLDNAITRTEGLVQYFGIMATGILTEEAMLDAADVIQTKNKIGFFVGNTSTDIDEGGKLDKLRSGTLTKSRGLFYGGTEVEALEMMAAYAGRALSTNFNGSNTTQNMHLKSLSGVQPDATMTQTLLTKAQDAGVDVYISIQGVAKTFCSGANKFFDRVYNLEWLIGALSVAGFNVLATTGTKIPQTEQGIGSLKSSYRSVCEQAVTNQFLAPGTWTSPTTFGVQAEFLSNIEQFGYYIYSTPVSQQLQSAREAREAPLIQIAVKEAGAVDSSSVIINVNA